MDSALRIAVPDGGGDQGLDSLRPPQARAWGCPTCRWTESWVDDTARDEDGFVVRLRRCTSCGTTWATEERPITRSAYWSRKGSGTVVTRQRWHANARRWCCGHVYHGTNYGRHQRTAKHRRLAAAA